MPTCNGQFGASGVRQTRQFRSQNQKIFAHAHYKKLLEIRYLDIPKINSGKNLDLVV
jgi:hypothetical protein